MINILVTGSKGQLGSSLQSLENKFSDYNLLFTDIEELDLVNYAEVENYITAHKINVVINCAAYTNVDQAEVEYLIADTINNLAVENLARIAKKFHLKLIHISTDYVFDGNSLEPYTESDKPNPKTVYGLTKMKGEQAIQKLNPPDSLIIRTSWLYSAYGRNFVKTILKLSNEKEKISVVSDQIGSPTCANDLALVILQMIPLIKNKSVQIYHYANKGKCSWFQFADEIVTFSGHSCIVEPIPSEAFETKANRPKFSLLNTKKIESAFHLDIPYWKDSLKNCLLDRRFKG
jgi:dTDP-4-dehydrorhamnose reductase